MIPIRNLYYLLCYAWDRLEAGRIVEVGAVRGPGVAELFARVLASGTRYLLRRGLEQRYRPLAEDTTRPRGRIDFAATLQRVQPARGRLHCRFDELDADTPANRLLKTTIHRLAHTGHVDPELRRELRRLDRRLVGIAETDPNREAFRAARAQRATPVYGLLLDVCELALANLLPEPGGAGYRFRDFVRDEEQMQRVFEVFVYRFYRRHGRGFRATAQRPMRWRIEPETEAGARLLPTMRPDLLLEAPNRTIVLDTKYYRDAFQRHFDKPTFHSPNLYQMYAYVDHAARQAEAGMQVEGILLYPAVGVAFDERYHTPEGRVLRVATVDLGRPWPEIHRALLALVGVAAEG